MQDVWQYLAIPSHAYFTLCLEITTVVLMLMRFADDSLQLSFRSTPPAGNLVRGVVVVGSTASQARSSIGCDVAMKRWECGYGTLQGPIITIINNRDKYQLQVEEFVDFRCINTGNTVNILIVSGYRVVRYKLNS